MTEPPRQRKPRVRINPTLRVIDPEKLEAIREFHGLIGPQATIDFLIAKEYRNLDSRHLARKEVNR